MCFHLSGAFLLPSHGTTARARGTAMHGTEHPAEDGRGQRHPGKHYNIHIQIVSHYYSTHAAQSKARRPSTGGWKISNKNLTHARLPIAFLAPSFLPWLNWETSVNGFAGANADLTLIPPKLW